MIIESILTIVVAGFLLFAFLNWRDNRHTKKVLKNYDEKEDKSKQGERRRSTKRRSPESKKTEPGNAGSVELERRQLLQATKTSPPGKTSNSSGKPKRGLKNLVRKLKRG